MRKYASKLTEFARANRKQPTRAEELLWARLRGNREDGLRFRRQQPLGPYIVDFLCSKASLVIEVDGESHAYFGEGDADRANWIAARGYMVFRITNEDVIKDPRGTALAIVRAAYRRVPELSHLVDDLPVY